MNQVDMNKVVRFVDDNIVEFHNAKLASIKALQLNHLIESAVLNN